jgi:hypothetical protein
VGEVSKILGRSAVVYGAFEFDVGDDLRGGSVCLNTVRGVSKWMSRPFQAAAGIGVARLMYA